MGNGISTATRSRVAVCIAALSILIGFSSPAFAKGRSGNRLETAWRVHDIKKTIDENCKDEKSTWGTLRKKFCRLEQRGEPPWR